MYFFTKILYAGVVLHVAFQAASSAILRGRSGDADIAQLEPHLSTRALTDQLVDLDAQLGQFLDTYSTSHKRPTRDTTDDAHSVDVVLVAKRQTIQIPQQALQDLLKLIQSIETQLTSIISAGASQLPPNSAGNAIPGASSGPIAPSPVRSASLPTSNPPIVGPSASNPPAAASNSVNPPISKPPIASPPTPNPPATSNPVNQPVSNPPVASPPAPDNSDVGPIVPSPFLTSAGSGPGDPITTAYGTATTTGTRCKTTLTQTFTAYVYEDGTPAGTPVVARDVQSTDDAEDSGLDGREENAKGAFEVEESLGGNQASATADDDKVDLDGKESLKVLMARRESQRSPDRSNPHPVRESDGVF